MSTSDDARVGEMLVNLCPGVNGAVVFPRCILPNHCPMATGNTLVRKQEYCDSKWYETRTRRLQNHVFEILMSFFHRLETEIAQKVSKNAL